MFRREKDFYIRKEERSQINNLSFYLKKAEKEEITKPKARRNEIIKIRVEINDIKKIEKINKSKSWFFEKNQQNCTISQTDQETKREKSQITKIRNERRNTTKDLRVIRKIRDYYEQLYAINLDNLDKMKAFQERYKLLKPTQKEIENLYRLITTKDIELVIKNISTKKAQTQMD